jgi:DNA-binding transcriptional LysR family regulator
MAAGVISSVVDQLSHTCPKLAFRMEIGDAAARVRLLRERRCEFVVARQELPGGQDDLDVRPLFYERPFVVAGPKSKWLGRRRLSLADLINEPWILTQRETHPNSPVFKAFQLSGVALPRVVVLSDSLNVRNSLLTDGRFLTVVPGSILRFGPERHLLTKLPIKLQSWPEPIALTTLKGRTLSPPAQLFIDCVHRLAEPLARQK